MPRPWLRPLLAARNRDNSWRYNVVTSPPPRLLGLSHAVQKTRFSSRWRRGVCRNDGHRRERAVSGWALSRWAGDRGAACRGRQDVRAPHTRVLPVPVLLPELVVSVSLVPSKVLGRLLPRLWVSLSVRVLRLPV